MNRAPDPSAGEPTAAGWPVDDGRSAESHGEYVPGDREHPPGTTARPPATTSTGPRPGAGSSQVQMPARQRPGIAVSTWVALILGAVILVLVLVFILQNNVPADFSFLGWSFELPLGIAMLFATIAGLLVMALFGSVLLVRDARRVRRLEKELAALRQGR
ncbi:LapA family protein [Georgenia sp. Z1491]|uniref:LapA family protein n=1 Tax=Georgenia sp. Z1491 TaxID=3416707 RepID=UPI003CF5F680